MQMSVDCTIQKDTKVLKIKWWSAIRYTNTTEKKQNCTEVL